MWLSIITINFNNKEGLIKTVNSVFNQQNIDYEYIIIDGGSTDGSREWLQTQAARFSFWSSEPDAGVYDAMNKGLRQAKGDFCLFLNSGDVLHAPRVLSEVQNWLKTPPPNQIFYGDILFDNGQKQWKAPYPDTFSYLDFLENSIPHPAAFIPRSLLLEMGGYDTQFKIVSDWLFFLRAWAEKRTIFQKIPVLVAVFDLSGISQNRTDDEDVAAIAHYFPTFEQDYKDLITILKFRRSRAHRYLEIFLGLFRRL